MATLAAQGDVYVGWAQSGLVGLAETRGTGLRADKERRRRLSGEVGAGLAVGPERWIGRAWHLQGFG